jgi:benzoylformate decarboxylase
MAVYPRRASAVMVDILRSEGVRYIFGNPGTTEIPLISALDGVEDISYILGLQEVSVVAMADGYAKISGRPGFANVHTAGGLGHAMGAILHAQIANTPLVVTAGQQDTRHGPMDPLLGGDLVAIARPAVKWAREVTHPDHLPMLLRRAFNDCKAAPSGPVFLSLPTDVMEQMTDVSAGARSQINRAAVAGGLSELSDALARGRRLAILAGDEIFSANACDETVELAEALGAPVFGPSWPGCQSFPATHPLWHGNLPIETPDIRSRLEGFEAVFVLGGHSLITYLYAHGPALPPTCRLLQLSADVNSLGRFYPATLSCLGDIKASLRALLPDLRRKLEPHRADIAALRERAALARAARQEELTRRLGRESDAFPATAFTAAHEVLRGIGSRAAIVDECPVTRNFVRACLGAGPSRAYLANRSAILGWGMPAAVGVSLGLDREPVVALLGDGSSLYSPQALWTAARERLPVTFVVMNNREYGILKDYMRGQEGYPGARADRFIGMDLTDPAIDFVALATSMGLPALKVSRTADIAGAVEAAIESGGPSLVEVPLS